MGLEQVFSEYLRKRIQQDRILRGFGESIFIISMGDDGEVLQTITIGVSRPDNEVIKVVLPRPGGNLVGFVEEIIDDLILLPKALRNIWAD